MSLDELESLKRRLVFQARVDEFLEAAARQRLSLADTLREVLPLLAEALPGADLVWLETLDDALEPRVFAAGGAPGQLAAEVAPDPALVAAASALVADDRPRGGRDALAGGATLLARRLDVAGESFGTLGARVGEQPEAGLDEAGEVLHVAAEVLDNYLASVRQAREKQRLLRDIHRALRHPIVHDGVSRAVARIAQSVAFDLLVVVYHMDEDTQDTLHYLVFRGEQLEFSSRRQAAAELDRLLRREGRTPQGPQLITNAEADHLRVVGQGPVDLATEVESEAMLRSLGYHECLESVLIAGVRDETTVGKLVVGSRHPLSTYERDVFDLFADVLQKRIVDFNHLGKLLHRTFPIPTVLRLLEEENHLARLTPQSAEISILYADLVSFTRLSEQILQDPVKVGALIETWSRGMTRILWEHGGVFDKLVGDCVIGLFGPPFNEQSAPERALACARAAADMVRFTRDVLSQSPAAAPIVAAGEPLGVAIGINDCPASVGAFGPNADFTAFSPGMNNTARLQSVASRDEVLVLAPMRPLIEQAAPGARFFPQRQERVKNVAEPLAFFPLDVDSLG